MAHGAVHLENIFSGYFGRMRNLAFNRLQLRSLISQLSPSPVKLKLAGEGIRFSWSKSWSDNGFAIELILKQFLFEIPHHPL